MDRQKFLKIITPMIILLCTLGCIIYVLFQKSKLKIEGKVNLKTINIGIDGGIQYPIDKQGDIKEFLSAIENLKEGKTTLKALEGKTYFSLILKSENDISDLKVYDGNVVYNNKVYGGKAVKTLNELIVSKIASGEFISTYFSYLDEIVFKLNEMQREYLYYFCDSNGAFGRREDLVSFLKGVNFKLADERKVSSLERTYPSYDILTSITVGDDMKTNDIQVMNNNIIAITISGKRFYMESDISLYDFINKKLPKYELGDLGDLYKAVSVKDKELGKDLTKNINWLNQVITQSDICSNALAPSGEKHTLIYDINGKNEELIILIDKIIFRGKEYAVKDVAENYEVEFVLPKENKNKTNAANNEVKRIELKDISKFMNNVYQKQNLLKPQVSISSADNITFQYGGKTIKYDEGTTNFTDKKVAIENILWNNGMLFQEADKSLMDIGDEELVLIFQNNDEVNTIKINQNGVYQNGDLMYSGRYQMNLIYSNLSKELEFWGNTGA